MTEKTKFWILLSLFFLSIALLVYLNHSSQQLLLSH